MPLVELLSGAYEPELVRHRRASIEWKAKEAMREEFSGLVFATLNHINLARATMQQFANMLVTRREGMLGVRRQNFTAHISFVW